MDFTAAARPVPPALRARYYADGHWRDADLWSVFEAVAGRSPGAVAFVDGARTLTFAALAAEAVRFSAALRGRARPGEAVVVHGRHCLETCIALLGCAHAGAVAAPLPHIFSADQVRAIVASTRATVVVALGEPAEVERVRAATAGGDATLVVPDGQVAGTGIAWSTFLPSASLASPPRSAVPADTVTLAIFSSGTTGVPKGVMHSSNTVRFAVEAYGRLHRIEPADTSLVVTAFGFVGSTILGVYLTLLLGCRTVLLRHWSADDALALVERHRVSHLLLMPTHALDVLASPRLDATDCSSLRRGVLAGIAEPQRLDARARFCAQPYSMYGMSESPGHVTGSPDVDWDRFRVAEGRVLPGAEVEIWDDDDRPVPPGTTGHLVVRGPNRFLGYFGGEQSQQDVLTPEGWFRTGDLGSLDADGFLTFVGRSKDIIRRGGVTVVPSDVETAVRAHPRVADVAVLGVPDPRLGERTCACVITRDGAPLSLAELTGFLEGSSLARYMWPEYVVTCEEFPRTPSLKVQKNELRTRVLPSLAKAG